MIIEVTLRPLLCSAHVLAATVACACFLNRFPTLLMSSDALGTMDFLLSCCGSRSSAAPKPAPTVTETIPPPCVPQLQEQQQPQRQHSSSSQPLPVAPSSSHLPTSSRPHGGQNASQSSGRAASEDDGLVEGQLHDLLKFLFGWLGRQGRLHSVHGSGKVDEDMFLTEVEIFLSDASVRSIDAFQKWLASPKSSAYSNAYAFGTNDTCSRFVCVLKNLNSFGHLSEQIRLFHTHRAASPS